MREMIIHVVSKLLFMCYNLFVVTCTLDYLIIIILCDVYVTCVFILVLWSCSVLSKDALSSARFYESVTHELFLSSR